MPCVVQIEEALSRGANVNSGNPKLYNSTAAHYAAREGHVAILHLLRELGASLDQQNYCGETPLHFAAETGQVEAVEMLLESGANVSIENSWNETAIDVAASHGEDECIRLLRKWGAREAPVWEFSTSRSSEAPVLGEKADGEQRACHEDRSSSGEMSDGEEDVSEEDEDQPKKRARAATWATTELQHRVAEDGSIYAVNHELTQTVESQTSNCRQARAVLFSFRFI